VQATLSVKIKDSRHRERAMRQIKKALINLLGAMGISLMTFMLLLKITQVCLPEATHFSLYL